MKRPAHDLAVVIVNYNSARLCASAVRSLAAQSFRGRDGGPGSLQLVVVDNASPQDPREELAPLAARGVDVVLHDRNDGYGAGMNLGFSRTDAEFVLLMNPDVLVLEGALEALLACARADPAIGVVGPRGYLDPDSFVLLPSNDLPTLALHALESLARRHPAVAAHAARARSRRYREAWLADRPLDREMVSGFAMLLRADLARELGPFDLGFPFYFEDADLCRRVRAAGRRVVLEPRARMIHFFDQSARSAREEVTRRYFVSRGRYYRKHYGRLGLAAFEALERYAARAGAAGWRHVAARDLGELDAPLSLEIPAAAGRGALLELATDPAFLFCGGHPFRGPSIRFPQRTWDCLEATTWYARVLDLATLAPLDAVTFKKTTHAKAPIAFEELSA